MCITWLYYVITLNIPLMHGYGTYYWITRAVVPTNPVQGTCHSAPFSTTYIRTCTADIATLAVIGSNTTFQSRLF